MPLLAAGRQKGGLPCMFQKNSRRLSDVLFCALAQTLCATRFNITSPKCSILAWQTPARPFHQSFSPPYFSSIVSMTRLFSAQNSSGFSSFGQYLGCMKSVNRNHSMKSCTPLLSH